MDTDRGRVLSIVLVLVAAWSLIPPEIRSAIVARIVGDPCEDCIRKAEEIEGA